MPKRYQFNQCKNVDNVNLAYNSVAGCNYKSRHDEFKPHNAKNRTFETSDKKIVSPSITSGKPILFSDKPIVFGDKIDKLKKPDKPLKITPISPVFSTIPETTTITSESPIVIDERPVVTNKPETTDKTEPKKEKKNKRRKKEKRRPGYWQGSNCKKPTRSNHRRFTSRSY